MPSFIYTLRAASFAAATVALACAAACSPAAQAQLKSGPPVAAVPPTPVKPWVHVPFPEIHDFNSVVIKLSGIPVAAEFAFDAELHGDGTVIFEGNRGVTFPGPHRCSIRPENVRALIEYMRERDYFSYDDKYVATTVSDGSITETSIAFDDKRKSVYDYEGTYAGIPGGALEIEQEIARVMGVNRWLFGNEDTMRCLRAENFDFRSAEAANAVYRLKRPPGGDKKLLFDLAAAGAGDGEEIVLRRALYDADHEHGLESAMHDLQMANLDMTLLGLAADVGNPELVSDALHYERNVDARDWRGLTPLMIAVSHREYFDQDAGLYRAWVVHLLLEAGADPNLADKDGNTAMLLNRYDPDAVQYFLKAGVKIDAQNYAGETALMRAESPELANILLLNHANPWLRNAARETALDIAKREHNDAKVAVLTKALTPSTAN
jgi:hypothetical protein